MTPETTPETTSAHLKSNVIGLLGAATLGVVFLSPAMTLYGLFGPIVLAAGSAAPLAFVFALLATLPTAYGYATLSRDFPSSGSAADWSARATSPRVGVWTGWIVFFYYFTNFIIQPVALGLFFTDLLKTTLGISSGFAHGAGFLLGVAFCCAWPAYMVYRGISVSAKGALIFLLIEISVVVALCASIIFLAPGRGTALSGAGFSLAAASLNTSGLFRAMVFGMLGFCGFDVISTVAEETKMARKLIPQATMLALFFYAVLIIGGMWALTMGGDQASLKQAATEGRMPINDVALSFWGRGSLLVTLTAISATLGLAIVTSVGASRILFDLGRRGAANPRFSLVHPRYQTPWNALHLIYGGGLLGAIALFSLVGSYNAYVWWCTTSTFFAMLTYFFVNAAVILLNRARLFASPQNFVLYAAIPAIGIAADLYIVTQSFFIELWKADWATGKSVVIFDVALACLAIIFALTARHAVAAPCVPEGTGGPRPEVPVRPY